MAMRPLAWLRDRVPGGRRIGRLPGQVLRTSPFSGSIRPTRVPLFAPGSGRPSLPFPHPWNYRQPLRILEAYFWKARADLSGSDPHNRYLDVPGFPPVLVTRDSQLIRAISTNSGDRAGQFDRDTMPSVGIARATGSDTLLYANGPVWKRQKKLVTPAFARATLFQPEQFHEFEAIFRRTVRQRLEVVRQRAAASQTPLRVQLEPEIKAIMLEMLVNGFFGADIAYEKIRNRYAPALDRVIDFIVTDTVLNRPGIPLRLIPAFTRSLAESKRAQTIFEELTDAALTGREEGRGLWRQFKSDAPDAKLRSNVRVFLAGALEATTSYASWALDHLARHPDVQEALYQEIRDVDDYTPDALASASYLGWVLNETLRLTPSLYFHPRLATADTRVETADGRDLWIPKGTHVLLDVWHANRREDIWGRAATGYPAAEFAPQRWAATDARDHGDNDRLHFGFGHGPRFCPGKNLGQLEVALVVGACVKLFRLKAIEPDRPARAGVSTKPSNGVLIDLTLREPAEPRASSPLAPPAAVTGTAPRCPFARG